MNETAVTTLKLLLLNDLLRTNVIDKSIFDKATHVIKTNTTLSRSNNHPIQISA